MHTHSGAGPTDYGFGARHAAPSTRARRDGGQHRPLHVLIWAGVFERHPDLKLLDRENGNVVGAGRHPQDGREVDRRPQHPRSSATPVPRNAVNEAERVPDRNCFLGASTPGVDDIERRHAIEIGNIMWGNDLPHPEGTFPYTRVLDPRAVSRRATGRGTSDVG